MNDWLYITFLIIAFILCNIVTGMHFYMKGKIKALEEVHEIFEKAEKKLIKNINNEK